MLRRSGSVGAVPRAAPRQVSSHARPAASRLPAALAADHPPLLPNQPPEQGLIPSHAFCSGA